jgi:hypothetical protein
MVHVGEEGLESSPFSLMRVIFMLMMRPAHKFPSANLSGFIKVAAIRYRLTLLLSFFLLCLSEPAVAQELVPLSNPVQVVGPEHVHRSFADSAATLTFFKVYSSRNSSRSTLAAHFVDPDTTAQLPRHSLVRALTGLAIGAGLGGFLGYEYGGHDDRNCQEACGVSARIGLTVGSILGGAIGFFYGLATAR